MAELVYFTVTGKYDVIVTDDTDAGADPDHGIVTGLVTFTPSVSIDPTDKLAIPTTLLLRPLVGRIDTDGVLKTIDEEIADYTLNGSPVDENGAQVTENTQGATAVYGVRLLANTEALGPLPSLIYTVSFSKVRFDKDDRSLPSFAFAAPDEDTIVDLATVPRVG